MFAKCRNDMIDNTSRYEEPQPCEISPGQLSSERTNQGCSWGFKSQFGFEIACYTVEQFLESISTDSHILKESNSSSVPIDVEESKSAMTMGMKMFCINGKIITYETQINSSYIKVSDISLKSRIDEQLKMHNPLRKKNLQLYGMDFMAGKYEPPPSVTLEQVILPEILKEDLYDNTIFSLECGESNGIILHGDPGVGKSLVCAALVNEAIKKGFNTCHVAGLPDFNAMDDLIDWFLSPCLVILEDVDSYGLSREGGINYAISKFLQFINGVSERTYPVVFVATTNHLEALDKAISNRPVRFNRKFEFKPPTNGEIDQLMELYFKTDLFNGMFHDKKFTGAHVRELKRTADILLKKRGKTDYKDVIDDAKTSVCSHFSINFKKVGFG